MTPTKRLPAPAGCLGLLGAALLALVLTACGDRSDNPPDPPPPSAATPTSATTGTAPDTGGAPAAPASAVAAAAAASGPPVSVTVVRAQPRDVAVEIEATGAVSALASVDVKPQVASVVTAVHVREGQFVARGQPLFTLDGRADAANLARADAQLLRDQATLVDAQRQLTRAQELVAQGFVSQGAVDTAQASVDAQRAAVAADRAAIDAARVQLSYSRISAPSAGRVGQINVFVGSSVAPTGAALVSITQLDPIAVSFNLPQRNLADALRVLGATALPPAVAGSGAAPALRPGQVQALLPEGRGLRVGRLDFVDNLVDPASGTVRVKALFANKDQSLWPGAYVNVRLSLQSLPGAIVVPQASIVQGARGTAVFVVDAEGRAAMRPVKVLQALGTDAAVSGLVAGETVVLDGRQNVRPGVRLVVRAPDRAPRAGAGGAAASAGLGGPTGPAGSAPRAGRGASDSRPAP